jgi:hypothetical protein
MGWDIHSISAANRDDGRLSMLTHLNIGNGPFGGDVWNGCFLTESDGTDGGVSSCTFAGNAGTQLSRM